MSTIKVDTLVAADGSSPVTLTKQSAPKAWVNADQDPSLVNNDSFNISSLGDDGAGKIDVNYTNSFANDDYSTACANGNGEYMAFPRLVSASDTQLASYNVDGNAYTDTVRNCMVCCGDLA